MKSLLALLAATTAAIVHGQVTPTSCNSQLCQYMLNIGTATSATVMDSSCLSSSSLSPNQGTMPITFTANWSYPIEYMCNGTLKKINRAQAMTMITTDGYSRQLLTVNGQFPGPLIEMTLNSTIQYASLNVKNMISRDSTSVSFNGVKMLNAPYMAGSPFVSQCAIGPSEEFAYRFKLDPADKTNIYESLQSGQGVDGLSGPFRIRNMSSGATRGTVIEVADWYPYEFDTLLRAAPYDWNTLSISRATARTKGFYGDPAAFFANSRYVDGSSVGFLPYWSILIGGRGYLNDATPGPVKMYSFPKLTDVMFHFIHTGIEKAIEIDIPMHKLKITGKDGYPFGVPVEVDALWILPGEEFDVTVTLGNVSDNYPIRARVETDFLRLAANLNTLPRSFAVLNYNDVAPDYPSTALLNFVQPTRRNHFNCPFTTYSLWTNHVCYFMGTSPPRRQGSFPAVPGVVGPNQVNVTTNEILGQVPKKVGKMSIQLNLGTARGVPNINGFVMPPLKAPVQLDSAATEAMRCDQVYANGQKFCGEADFGTSKCTCRHQYDIPLGTVVTLLLTNFGPPIDATGTASEVEGRQTPAASGLTQTFTIAGHTLNLFHQGVYIGDCQQTTTTAATRMDSINPTTSINSAHRGLLQFCPSTATNYYTHNDFDCNRFVDPLCFGSKYRFGVPGNPNNTRPVQMNSVAIPFGHYVSVKFLADNPGVWLARSTNKILYNKGLSMLFRVTLPSASQFVAQPSNLPQCGTFQNNTNAFALGTIASPTPPPTRAPCPSEFQFDVLWFILGIGSGLLLQIACYYVYYLYTKERGAEAGYAKPKPPRGRGHEGDIQR